MTPTTHPGRLLVALLVLAPVACGQVATHTDDQGAASPPSSAGAGADGPSHPTPRDLGEGGHPSKETGGAGSSSHAAGHGSGTSGASGNEAIAGASSGDVGDVGGTAGSAGQPGAAGAPSIEGSAGHAGEGAGEAGGGGAATESGGAAGGGGAATEGGGAAGWGGGAGSFGCYDLHGPTPAAFDAHVRVVGKAPFIDGLPASRIFARWQAIASPTHPYTYTVVYAHALLGPDGSFDLGAVTEAGQYQLTLYAEPTAGTAWQYDFGLDRATPPLVVFAGNQGDVTSVAPETFGKAAGPLSCVIARPPGVRIPGKK